MKIIFFGLGSIGQRHAKILLKNYNHELYAFRSGTSKDKNSLGIEEIYSFDDIKKLKPEIAFITNPTSLHLKTAIKCATLSCKLFIEKPIDKDLGGLDELLKIVKKKKLVTYVAYNMRFHPVIIYLKNFLKNKIPLHIRVVSTSYYPNWRSGRNHLEVYSAKLKMGGGIILDLSHELDYLSFLLGSIVKIKGNFSKVGRVTVDAEDYTDMLIETKVCEVNVHLNFLSHINQRYIQIEFHNFTVIADLISGEIVKYQQEKLTSRNKLSYDRNRTFEEQLKYFFDNIENPRMMNNLVEASNLYKKIISFKNKNEE